MDPKKQVHNFWSLVQALNESLVLSESSRGIIHSPRFRCEDRVSRPPPFVVLGYHGKVSSIVRQMSGHVYDQLVNRPVKRSDIVM